MRMPASVLSRVGSFSAFALVGCDVGDERRRGRVQDTANWHFCRGGGAHAGVRSIARGQFLDPARVGSFSTLPAWAVSRPCAVLMLALARVGCDVGDGRRRGKVQDTANWHFCRGGGAHAGVRASAREKVLDPARK